MEIAVLNPQAVLQMYPWHSVAPPRVADKETIIANADFTTTSAIARRRLSSKKRRKPEINEGICSDGSVSSSPTGSLGSPTTHTSPEGTANTQSPPVQESSMHRSLSDLHHSIHHPSHTQTNQVVPSHPHAISGVHNTVPLVPAAYHLAPTLPMGNGSERKTTFTHPMYSHLQQELNYRYLQEQSDSRSVHGDTAAFSAPHSQAGNPMAVSTHTAMDTSSSSTSDTRPVKWCSAHITIAKRIQAHQQQAKEAAHGTGIGEARGGTKSKPALDAAQQMALLQMYGVQATAVPGYMAMSSVPYSMPEVQLRNLSFVPHTAPTALFMDAANVLSVKPMAAGITSQASDNSNLNVHMVNGVQLLPYTQSLPVAAVMPSGINTAVQGSYIGPVPVPVIGNCVLNPCQPGVMATPWVR